MKVYRTLDPEQFQMDFVVSEENGLYTEEVLSRGGRIYYVPPKTKDFLGAMKGIRRIVKDNAYETVLKLGDSPIQVVDLLAAWWGGAKKRILRSCNACTGLTAKQKLRDAIFRPVLNSTANVKLAPSALAAAYTFGQKQLDKGNVCLLNNGVDLNIFHYDPAGATAVKQEFSLEGKTVIGHIGRFNQQKNHTFLLEVFSKIRQSDPGAMLLLVGKGELEQQIREQAEQLCVGDSVIFTGVRQDVPALLSAMDVIVFPSFYEGMPNTVIEAQATGLSCVIADTITKDANITGLVEYHSLQESAESWAEAALQRAKVKRMDTRAAFHSHGYEIGTVAEHFKQLIFG